MKTDSRMAILVVVLMLAILLPVVWLISTEEQRSQYRVWFGLAEPASKGDEEKPAAPFDFAAIESSDEDALGRQGKGIFRHGDVSACDATKVPNPAKVRSGDVYRWTDENGRVQFGDKPPDNAAEAGAVTVPVTGRARFSAAWSFDGLEAPALLTEELERTADGVFRFFEHTLQLNDMAPLQVNLRVIKGRKRFAAYRKKKSPSLTTDTGFYRFADNEAVVRWTNKAQTITTAQHEIAHLVVGNLLGDIPLWVNEGLSEVAERLTFSGSGMLAQPDPEAIKTLATRAGGRGWPSLRRFIGFSRKDWDRQGETFSYQYAWSLVHFLLEDAKRRDLLVTYARDLAAHRCQSFDTAGFLDRHYEGGLDRMETDWREWLKVGRPQAIAM